MNLIEETDALRLLREAMIAHQLRDSDVTDTRLLRAMTKIPRHFFVPSVLRCHAYEDRALPIGDGQLVAQPYLVAKLLEALQLTGTERVLEVGTGCGYQTAVLCELVREVWSMEAHPDLAKLARSRLEQLGYANAHVVTGDGRVGLPEHGVYDAIIVSDASLALLPRLLEQLSPVGRLVVPVGDGKDRRVRRLRRLKSVSTAESLVPCAFAPLASEDGWSADTVGGAPL